MGTACAICSEVKQSRTEGVPGMPPELDESELGSDGSDEQSEVAASSEDNSNQEDYKQGVEEILKSTGNNLKRGKTMAMKEAISTAKKYGLETSKISEAEKALDDHKRQQRREECEKEVAVFFESPACKDIASTENMLKKAKEAECSSNVIKRVKESLEELILTRPLEDDELEVVQRYLKQSCRDFVLSATKIGGREVTMLDLDDGKKIKATICLDPPLVNLLVMKERETLAEVPVSSLNAVPASDDKTIRANPNFNNLKDDDCDCAVAVRYAVEGGKLGVWCFLEPTPVRRDRFIEAVSILTKACK